MVYHHPIVTVPSMPAVEELIGAAAVAEEVNNARTPFEYRLKNLEHAVDAAAAAYLQRGGDYKKLRRQLYAAANELATAYNSQCSPPVDWRAFECTILPNGWYRG